MPPKSKAKSKDTGRITIENVNVPGYTVQVEARKYEAMRTALLKAIPTASPGLTQSEMQDAVLEHLPDDLFPGGEKSNWWAKMVQLDLEAKGILAREPSKPLRWHLGSKKK